YKDLDEKFIEQHFLFSKYGEQVHLLANYTLVKNGTLVSYTVENHGSAPWDFGWKYSWDTHLNGNLVPPIYVDNRPGDGDGPPGTYDQIETDFGLSHDIKFVKVWQTRNGPDKATDLKAYFWWDPAYGGTPPDLVQYMNSGRAISGSSSWMYTLSSSPVSTDNELQTYFGWPDLIPLAPNDGMRGGPDEATFHIWYGTGIPDPLPRYGIQGSFANRPADQTSSTTFIDAGETAIFPISIKNTPRPDVGPLQSFVEFTDQVISLPPGWTYEIVDADTGRAAVPSVMGVNEVKNLLLKVTAPSDAYGNDAARIGVGGIITDRMHDAYDIRGSVFETSVFTTTIVRPNYGLEMYGDEEVPNVQPGESAQYTVLVKNRGNLREPIPVTMDIASGLGLGWGLDIDPPTYSLGRGESQEVSITLDIPASEFGGERTLVARASVPEQNQFNTTVLKMRILTDSFIEIIPDLDEIILAPGDSVSFEALVINHGADEAAINLHGAADQIVGISGESDPEDWTVELDATGFETPLPPGGSTRFPITVYAPQDALAGEQKNILLFATEKGTTNKLDERLVQAVVGRASSLELDSVIDAVVANPAENMEFQLQVRNEGNSLENLTLAMASLPAGWTAELIPDRFSLDVGQIQPVRAIVKSDPNALAGRYDLSIVAKNADQLQSSQSSLSATIRQVYLAELQTERTVLHKLPSDTLDLTFQITNAGNGLDHFALSGFPSNWAVVVDPAVTGPLQPGESALVHVTGRIGADVGQYQNMVEATSAASGEPVGSIGVTLFVARPDLVLREVEISSPANHVGDLEVIQAIIENTGGIEAPNVVVALYVDGVDSGVRVQFANAAPGQELVASLAWPRTAGEHTYRVMVDPDNLHDEGINEANNDLTLQPGENLVRQRTWLGPNGSFADKAAPAPAAVVVLAALVLLGRRRN
ncbi:MAG: CARDB domain-containing protein, partial [Thermoplasmatota archaeon]